MECLFRICILLTWFVFANSQQTPLCQICECQKDKDIKNNTTSAVDVDCSEKTISNMLYNSSIWMDEKNVSYPIIGLNLQHNNLQNLTTPFVNCSIKALSLANNSISSIENGVFANLYNLEWLVLSDNNLENLSPHVFKGYYHERFDYPLLALRELVLSNNKFHTLDQDLFEHTPNLEILVLSGNPLKILDVHTVIAIGSIPKLSKLDLSSTQLTDLPEHFLHTPKYLNMLNLSYNQFEMIPKTLADSQALEVLHFNGNPIKNFTHKIAFPHVKTLKKVHFCDMPSLLEIGAHTFGTLNNLVEVHICRNKNMSTIHPSAFNRKAHGANKVYPHIQKLYIQGNNLSHIDKHLLFHWEDLKDFDLSGNPWACDCKNHWLVYNLSYISEKFDPKSKYDGTPRIHHTKKFICSSPPNLKGMTLYELSDNKTLMDCSHSNSIPIRSIHSFVLAGVLSGLLVTICVLAILVFLYKKNHISYKKLSNYYTYRFKNTASEDVS